MTLNLTVGVTDLEQSEAFYRDLIGLDLFFQKSDHGFSFLLVDCGNCQIVLQPAAAMAATHPVLFQNFSRQQPGSGIQLELTCDNLAEVLARLEKKRWPVLYELDDQDHCRREVWVQDPDGYLLVLNQE